MPTGFRVLVTPEEIRQHCLDRAAWHREQASNKREELPKIRNLVDRLKGGHTIQMSEQITGYLAKGAAAFMNDPESPVRDLERDISSHATKAKRFDFLAAHLHPESYDLHFHELETLELVA